MPKAKLVTTHGLDFEAAMKRLIATPPPKAAPKAAPKGKQAAKQPKRGKR